MPTILMVIAPENFRDEELFETREELEQQGCKTTIASVKKGSCTGSLGSKADAQMDLKSVHADDFDGIVFVGGKGSSIFFDNEEALKLARIMYRDGKITSAICLAPIILARADILKKKNATVTPTQIDALQKKGASYAGSGVVTDGTIVTADGPSSSRLFGQTIARLLKKKEESSC